MGTQVDFSLRKELSAAQGINSDSMYGSAEK